MRRVEIYLTALLVALASLAAYLGSRSGWSDELVDPRLSTHLSGPGGARALAQALSEFGVTVERRERAYFTLADTATGHLFAFLDPSVRLTPRERERITTLAGRGGHLVLVGDTDLEGCFGVRIVPADDLPVTAPPPYAIPDVHRHYTDATVDDADDESTEGCAPVVVATEDTLLAGPDREPVALTLHLAGGGTVRFLADGALLSNETLRESDAGVILLPWLLESGHEVVVVDEYHHGFDGGASLWGATWQWLRSNPIGWMLLHLSAVSLLALFTFGARFGPPLPYGRDDRRSELEHVNALGMGLRTAGGHATAIDLLINGLRRRLGRSSPGGTVSDAGGSWTHAFDHLDAPEARRAVETLRSINTEPVATRVRTAAEAVEDLWTALTNKP